MVKLYNLRKNYTFGSLSEEDLHRNPFTQFEQWLQFAIKKKVLEPTAMALSTVSNHGIPSSRMVLLKEWSSKGGLFFTNSKSQKAFEMEAHPVVSCLFWWKELERQVSFTGLVKPVPRKKAAEYFALRPRNSQIATWVSMQGDPLDSKEILETAFEALKEKWSKKKTIPLPPHWNGYLVMPQVFQFWQGKQDRLHDRFLYKKVKGKWALTRLYP